jgi:uncharacterized protein YndB with AHSA1/START domain
VTSRVLVALRVRATPERTFDVFTREIALWWQPNGLFAFTRGKPGTLAFEPGEGGRFTETKPGGEVFEIGRITAWEPGVRLAFTWRPESFAEDQSTRVEVRFDRTGEETRVTVEHFAWDTIPDRHAARHGFPLTVFLQREGEWWQALLGSLSARASLDL